MAIDPTAAPYVPKTFYGTDGKLSIPGDTKTADAESTANAVGSGVRDYAATLPPSDRAAFLAAVNATGPATLAPGGKVAGDLTDKLTSIENGLKAFQSMLVSTNDFDMLARVMIEQFGQQRHDAVQDRMNMRQAAKDALLSSAGQLDKAATDMMNGAIASLVVSCVSAAVSIGASAVALGGQMKALKSEMGAAKELAPIEGELAGRLDGTAGKAGGKVEGEGVLGKSPPTADVAPKADAKPPMSKEPLGKGDVELPGTEKGAGGKGATAKAKQDDADVSKMTTKQLHEKAGELKVDIKAAEKQNAKFQFAAQVGTNVAHLGEAGANAASTLAQSQAKQAEADGKRDEAAAESANAQADLKKALVDSCDDMIKQLIAAVKDLQEAKAERMRAFSRI